MYCVTQSEQVLKMREILLSAKKGKGTKYFLFTYHVPVSVLGVCHVLRLKNWI